MAPARESTCRSWDKILKQRSHWIIEDMNVDPTLWSLAMDGSSAFAQRLCEVYKRGRSKAGLEVDATSLTRAKRVYERAGMRPTQQKNAYEKELRPGVDLRRHTLNAVEQ